MVYTVNTDYIKAVLDIIKEDKAFSGNPKEFQEHVRKYFINSDSTMKKILSGYLQAMEEAADTSNTQLDLTYDTVKNIPIAVSSLAFIQQRDGYDINRNKSVTAKTLAAYLTLLAINNHDIKLDIEQFANKRNESRPQYWADTYSLRLNFKKKSDFLLAAIEGIKEAPIIVDNGFMIDVDPIISAYKRVTNVDLSEYGLSQIVVNLA